MAAAAVANASVEKRLRYKLGQFLSLESWVKNALIVQFARRGFRMVELWADDREVSKWLPEGPAFVAFVNDTTAELKAAEAKFKAKGAPCDARFLAASPVEQDLGTRCLDGASVDLVAAFNSKLCRVWRDEATVAQMLQNVSDMLVPGGYFIGTLPDSSMVWHRSQKSAAAVADNFAGALYDVRFLDADDLGVWGCRYTNELLDGDVRVETLVHFPTLTRLAHAAGLRMVEIKPFTACWEDNGRDFEDLTRAWLVHQFFDELQPEVVELLALYTTFVFRKAR